VNDVDTVLEAGPDIFNHNVETVERLQKPVRVQGPLRTARAASCAMPRAGALRPRPGSCGSGERQEEIEQTLRDLAGDQVNILTVGQYPSAQREASPGGPWVPPRNSRSGANSAWK